MPYNLVVLTIYNFNILTFNQIMQTVNILFPHMEKKVMSIGPAALHLYSLHYNSLKPKLTKLRTNYCYCYYHTLTSFINVLIN